MGKSQKQRDPESDAVSPKTDVDHPEITQKADNKAKRLEVIADLLANLNKPERQKVIEQLSPADRAAVALMLVNEKD